MPTAAGLALILGNVAPGWTRAIIVVNALVSRFLDFVDRVKRSNTWHVDEAPSNAYWALAEFDNL